MKALRDILGAEKFAKLQADPVAFVRAFDRQPWPYQERILRSVTERDSTGKFTKPIAIVSMPRQNGKSTLSAWIALWRFFTDELCTEIVTVALDKLGAGIILGDARRIIRKSKILYDLLDPAWGLTKNEIRLQTGRRWIIRSSDEKASRGLRPSLICYDEFGWTSDSGGLFHVLSAGQAARPNPLMLLTSTVGPVEAGPMYELFKAHETGDPSIRLIYETKNLSPLITQKFLEKQRRILPASVYAREHQNLWGSGSDAFCELADWERAIEDGDSRRDRGTKKSTLFADLSWVHDETCLAVATGENGKAVIVAMETFKGSRAQPIRLASVEEKIRELVGKFNVKHVQIESPQGVQMSQQISIPGVKVEVLHPTRKSNNERWGWFYVALKNGGVRLPDDPILRRQLLTLTIKQTTTGWRVQDVPSIHNDRAVACAGAGYLVGEKKSAVKVMLLVDSPRKLGKRPSNLVICEKCGKKHLVATGRMAGPERAIDCQCGFVITSTLDEGAVEKKKDEFSSIVI